MRPAGYYRILPNKALHRTAIPLRFTDAGDLAVSNRRSLNHTQTMKNRVEVVLKRIQKAYLVLTVLMLPGTISGLLHHAKAAEIGKRFIILIIYTSAYYGLRRRREWVIPLILIFSAFQCFWCFVNAVHPAENMLSVISKIFVCLLLLFFVYQMSFFRRLEVRILFGAGGIEVF